MFVETIGLGCTLLGSVIIHLEHQVFAHVDLFGPIFGTIQYFGSLIPEINLGPDTDVILPPVPPVGQSRNKFQAPSKCGRPNVRSCTVVNAMVLTFILHLRMWGHVPVPGLLLLIPVPRSVPILEPR